MAEADIFDQIDRAVVKARQRWPGRMLYLVIGEAELAELKAAFMPLCLGIPHHPLGPLAGPSYRGLPIRSTAYWSGVQAVPYPIMEQTAMWEGRE